MKRLLVTLLFLCAATPAAVHAQLHSDTSGMYEAVVLQAYEAKMVEVPGTNAVHTRQNIVVQFNEGPLAGIEHELVNELTPVTEGAVVYIQYNVDINGVEYLYVFEIKRQGSVLALFGLFVVLLLIFGGMQGVRALAALGLGLLAIMYVLLPGLLAGYSPVVLSIAVAATVLFLALVMTHGFNRGSLIAFAGTTLAVCVTGLLAVYAIGFVHLTGIPSETEWYLALNAHHEFDLLGLLLGGIIIGVLGALDDIAITQVATVRELYAANASLTSYDVYTRAMRVGKAHVGSLVNTLALAYTGAALPLLLLFSNNASASVPFLNLEVFATEIVRIIVSSIGLVLTVPITTVLAAYFIRGHTQDVPQDLHTHHH